ncbi:TIGR02452 family protein [Nocardiopsis exhalans]|uniref:TIGR02452 family protein n=1 Tax=Nocardiopsis exhalans TaxID=163604 RepID=A0ABY5DAH8_9ACTN|nr:TIGR02452 family protein [Nocardiopsis exhalans]USY20096.1 TIGR02452 family protein [Nocardiopsis exhalans]
MSQRLREVWNQTREAYEHESYRVDGRKVDLSESLASMREGTRLHLPDEIAELSAPPGGRDTRFEVTGESTLAAARRVVAQEPGRVAALNFASARKPGGGVVNGAKAQEESLARASALYDSLIRCPEFYDHHVANRSLLYTDRVIWSPSVPVYRDDRAGWLPEAVAVDFLTAAAPNLRMIERNQPELRLLVPEALDRRARAVLAVAAHHGAKRLVLGAWGCGVFGNRPAAVAAAFGKHLLDGEFAGVFERVVFAVLDRDEAVRRPFEERFGG